MAQFILIIGTHGMEPIKKPEEPEDKYVERAKRVENRVKEYSVKSENLITKFIDDFVFFVDNIFFSLSIV